MRGALSSNCCTSIATVAMVASDHADVKANSAATVPWLYPRLLHAWPKRAAACGIGEGEEGEGGRRRQAEELA